MPRNYDTRNSQVFPRIDEIAIKYPDAGVPTIEYIERQAVVIDGRTHFLDAAPKRCTIAIDIAQFADRIPLIDPTTGHVIEGKTISLQELLLGMVAVLRQDQRLRDALQDQLEQEHVNQGSLETAGIAALGTDAPTSLPSDQASAQ